MNLLNETLAILSENNKSWKDVRWVGCKEFQIPIELFKKLADNEYHSGFGAQEVASDLLVVGDDWWLERYEYDGAEGWEFKTKPEEPEMYKTDIGKIMGGKWKTLEELNNREDK